MTPRSDNGRRELKRLLETFALRSRELTEAVAALGGDVSAEREIEESIREIKRLRDRLDEAGDNFLAFVEPPDAQGFYAEGGEPDEKSGLSSELS